ncbi:hypothetical protein OGAPHI_003426 [Ogataea philodendri]|uniref:Uncharacterized protein n=1 Tax=Ogataea philodendri TaxID=1378263 RepID=A0A9P8T5N9_9ASCO|nr:uncharacterized protein OGAPHI_003426 [Ogataea philodendri]KAH3666976.1 hypothetical protein OGAPHI_003426 [Ogataea philodendri]
MSSKGDSAWTSGDACCFGASGMSLISSSSLKRGSQVDESSRGSNIGVSWSIGSFTNRESFQRLNNPSFDGRNKNFNVFDDDNLISADPFSDQIGPQFKFPQSNEFELQDLFFTTCKALKNDLKNISKQTYQLQTDQQAFDLGNTQSDSFNTGYKFIDSQLDQLDQRIRELKNGYKLDEPNKKVALRVLIDYYKMVLSNLQNVLKSHQDNLYSDISDTLTSGLSLSAPEVQNYSKKLDLDFIQRLEASHPSADKSIFEKLVHYVNEIDNIKNSIAKVSSLNVATTYSAGHERDSSLSKSRTAQNSLDTRKSLPTSSLNSDRYGDFYDEETWEMPRAKTRNQLLKRNAYVLCVVAVAFAILVAVIYEVAKRKSSSPEKTTVKYIKSVNDQLKSLLDS